MSDLNSGALLAGFGLHLANAFSGKGFEDPLASGEETELKAARDQIEEFAYGKTTRVWVSDDERDGERDYGGEWVTFKTPGKLSPPFPAMHRDIEAIRGPLEAFIKSFQARSLDVIVIFDGLDRLLSPDKFWTIVQQDFRALRLMRVAVLAAAPLSVVYGEGRPISEHFDRVHHMPTLSPDAENNGHLKSVLSRRAGTGLLGPDEAELICTCSGGVLRDLITLARDAGEAAYIDGSDRIHSGHATGAIAQLGESYLRGLGPNQLNILRRLKKERSFDVASAAGMELLVTGRVLEYSATDFRVHPALGLLI